MKKLLFILLLAFGFSEIKFNKNNLGASVQLGYLSEKAVAGFVNISIDYSLLKNIDLFCGFGTAVIVNGISIGAKYYYKDFNVSPFISSSISTMFAPGPCSDCLEPLVHFSSGLRIKTKRKKAKLDEPKFGYINIGFIYTPKWKNNFIAYWPIINYELKF